MHNDFILINKNIFNKERKDFIITIHTITPVGKQYKDSAYICSRKRLILINYIYIHDQVKFTSRRAWQQAP